MKKISEMKKFIKKMTAFVCGLALVAPLVLIPGINAHANETFAYLRFANSDWSVAAMDGEDTDSVTVTNPVITGEGTYTATLEFADPVDSIAFFNIEIKDGPVHFPGAYMNIDSIKFDDNEIEFGSTYSNDDEGNIRTNLYNEWTDGTVPADGRTNGAEDATATPISNEQGEFSKIDVTFTLELPKSNAYLLFASGDWGIEVWGPESTDIATSNGAEINGLGTYTVSMDFAEPAAGTAFAALIIDNDYLFPSVYMQIDSVKVDGEEIAFGNSYTNYEDGNIRTNLFNEWVAEVTEGITADGSFDNISQVPMPNDLEMNSLEVTFTLVRGVLFGGGDADEDYEVPSEFLAFMMFQDNGGGEWSKFEPVAGNEVWITGDGIWEVSLTRDQAGGTGQAIPDESGLVFLVDINDLGKAMKHIGTMDEDGNTDLEVSVNVYIDGNKVKSDDENIKYGDIEGNGRLRLELVNTWGTGTLDYPVVMPQNLTPDNEIRVEFSIKGTGFNSDFDWSAAEAEEPAPTPEPTPAPTPEPTPAPAADNDGGFPTWAIIVIVLVVIAVVCAVVVLSKKKKD